MTKTLRECVRAGWDRVRVPEWEPGQYLKLTLFGPPEARTVATWGKLVGPHEDPVSVMLVGAVLDGPDLYEQYTGEPDAKEGES